MAVDIHQKIRAYLRQNGKTDMGGFHLDWMNGRTSIGRWDYPDVPQPTNDSLTTVEQQYLDYETEPAHTRDIYRAVVVNEPTGFDWATFNLAEERRSDVTELTAQNSIKLSKGFWEMKLQGISSSVFTLQIARGDGRVIYQKECPVGRFTDTHLACAEHEMEIRVRAQRKEIESTLDPEFIIVLGRI
jgi:hypothetical protein